MVFTTILMFTYIASSQTTISVAINAGVDDAEEITATDGEHVPGYVDNFSSDLELCTETEGAPQWVGMIFRNIEIPVGATITEAYIQFTVDDDNAEEITVTIYGANESNIAAEGFTDVDFNVTSHPLTVAAVSWQPVPWTTVGDAGPDQRTPDISSIITEIIAIDGWASCNALMILVHDPSTIKAHREADSYDGAVEDGDATKAPTLHVTFTEDAPQEVTISVPVVDSWDDVEEYMQDNDLSKDPPEVAGFIDNPSSDLELCNETEGVQQLVGIIFRNVQIPVGSSITSANVQFCADDDNDEVITLSIWGAKLPTVPAPFTDALFGVSSLTKTTAKVEWTPEPWTAEMASAMATGPEQQTPDLSSIITEIIGVDGWASGNNICIMLMDESGTVKQHREAESWDGATDDNAGVGIPTLNVTFTEGGGTGVNSVSGEFSSLIYPNPTEGELNINNPSAAKFGYEIYAISGKLVSSKHNITGPTTVVDMSNFVKGMYFVNVRTAEKTETHKIILK
jgi:hypothetical protein